MAEKPISSRVNDSLERVAQGYPYSPEATALVTQDIREKWEKFKERRAAKGSRIFGKWLKPKALQTAEAEYDDGVEPGTHFEGDF